MAKASPKKSSKAEIVKLGGTLTVHKPEVVALPATLGGTLTVPTTALAKAMTTNVQSPVEEAEAHATIKWLKGVIKEIDGAFKPAIDSANAALKAVKELRDKIRGPFCKAEEHVRTSLSDYGTVQRLLAEAQEAETKAALPPELAAGVRVSVTPAVSALSYRDHYDVTLSDKDAFAKAFLAGQLPADAITLDLDWVMTRIKQTNGKVEIPGVTINKSSRPVVR